MASSSKVTSSDFCLSVRHSKIDKMKEVSEQSREVTRDKCSVVKCP